jgi:hypothetical protein
VISQAEAADWARAYWMGQRLLEPYAPRGPIYNHDLAEYFFFRVVSTPNYVGGDQVIAVRKTDARISHCGMIGA